MGIDWSITIYLSIWLVVMGVIFLVRWQRTQVGVGLTFAYLATMWIIHWLASASYIQLSYVYYPRSIIADGVQQSLYAVVGFAVGSIGFLVTRRHSIKTRSSLLTLGDEHLPPLYIFGGLFSYFVLFPVSGFVPSLTALVSAWNQLIIVGIVLACWQAWQTKNRSQFNQWVLIGLAGLPILTLVSQGFLGYGVVSSIIILMFLISFIRARKRVVLLLLLVVYLMLSIYVTYMRDRGNIRLYVWGGARVAQRTQVIYEVFSNFEWFDPSKPEHLHRIDDRLNQNWLVGTAVYYMHAANVSFADGETIGQAFLALIPRILWPGKPLYAGSPGLVTRYTGVGFAYGTSVGIGQVMEFYINFGSIGVLLGFIVVGTLLGLIDEKAAMHLQSGHYHGFLCWYLPGLSFLQIGGSLVEISASVGGGLISVLLMTLLSQARLGKRLQLRRVKYMVGYPHV